MTECIPGIRLELQGVRPVDVSFDGPTQSSDAGELLVAAVDRRLGLTESFAKLIPDQRDPSRVMHSRHSQLQQRVHQIVLGYEDCNDATRLRHDPVLKTTIAGGPKRRALASQPTLSRFENVVDSKALRALLLELERSYVDGLPADTTDVVFDIDGTDDPTHGQQELTFFHGYYDTYMYHPLVIFDGNTGDLVTGLLRHGKAHAARGAAGLLTRVIRAVKKRFPHARVLVRADSGICVPRILRRLEELDEELGGIDYLLGIAKNRRLDALSHPLMARAEQLFAEQGGTSTKRFGSFPYRAGSWERSRRVIAKAEYHSYGPNPRYVITSLGDFDPRLLYEHYCQRGQAENYIKDLKRALAADRLSCCSFAANFFRFIEHMLAYRLMFELRRQAGAVRPELATRQFDTLRLWLLKVAAIVKASVRRISIQLPKSFPFADTFRELCRRLMPTA